MRSSIAILLVRLPFRFELGRKLRAIGSRVNYLSNMAENRQLVPTGVSVVLALIVGWLVLGFVFKLVAILTNLIVIAGLIAVVLWLFTRQQKKV